MERKLTLTKSSAENLRVAQRVMKRALLRITKRERIYIYIYIPLDKEPKNT